MTSILSTRTLGLIVSAVLLALGLSCGGKTSELDSAPPPAESDRAAEDDRLKSTASRDHSSVLAADVDLRNRIKDAMARVNLHGDERGARQILLEAVKMYPQEAEAHYAYGNFLFNFFQQREGFAEIEKELRLARRLDPKHEAARLTLQEVYFAWARQERSRGDFAGAIRQYDKAIENQPTDWRAYANRAEARKDSLDLDKPFPPDVLDLALADVAKAIELQPNNAALYSNRAVARRMKKDLQGARLDLDKAIALEPSDAMFYANRGLVFLELGSDADAEKDFAQAMKLDPSIRPRLEPLKEWAKSQRKR